MKMFKKNLKNSENFSSYFQWKLSEKSENSNLFCFYICSFIISNKLVLDPSKVCRNQKAGRCKKFMKREKNNNPGIERPMVLPKTILPKVRGLEWSSEMILDPHSRPHL